jgi:hypothetical protein
MKKLENDRTKLIVLLGLFSICFIFHELLPKLAPNTVDDDSVDWPFWIANCVQAVLLGFGILLSYWWAVGATKKHGFFFLLLCWFVFAFVSFSSAGILKAANLLALTQEFQIAKGNFKAESLICEKFIRAPDAETRAKAANAFYSFSGINLMEGNTNNVSPVVPSEDAIRLRLRHEESEQLANKTQSMLKRFVDRGTNAGILHLIVVFLICAIGGVWFSRRMSGPGV